MMILKLISHGWKRSLRSASRGQNTAGNVVLLIIVILLGLNLLGLGLHLHALLKKVEPGVSPVLVFSGWVVYYLGIDLLLRQLFQRIPGQAIVPYLTLRIKKSLLVHLLLLRSFATFFNLLPWLLVIPFAVTAVIPGTGPENVGGWLVALGCLVAANSLLSLLLKKLAVAISPVALTLVVVTAAVVSLDFFDVVSISDFSAAILSGVLANPSYSVLFLVGPTVLYFVIFYTLRHKMYLEDLYPAIALREDTSPHYRFLESLGARGRFIALELKLFFRNRRPRASIVMALAILPLGILFYGMMFKDLRDPYPIPRATGLESARRSEEKIAPPGFCLVTFYVDTGIVPSHAHVYVTGDHPTLGKWKPSALPLLRNADSSWSRSFLLNEGTELRYCFTLGAWETEEKVGDGSKPPVYTMTVRSDTTVVRSAIVWKTPEIPLLVMINLLYWGLLITGIVMFAYGQFFLSWDSTFFDALMTWRINFRWLLETKVIAMGAAGVLSFALTLPYVFMDARILLVNSLAFVYNIGVNSYVLLYLASRTRKRFELHQSIFSQQGKGAAQFVAILPMWFLPIVAYAVLQIVGVSYALYLWFGGAGLLGLLFHRPLLKRGFALLEKHRYEIASGFREGENI